MPEEKNYHWSEQSQAKDCEIIDCPNYDDIKDFRRDPSGFYVLIRVNFDYGRIEAALCDKSHVIHKIFRGKRAQELYDTILKYEKKHHSQWFKEKTHIAYLGKELKKAEIALVMGQSSYYQE